VVQHLEPGGAEQASEANPDGHVVPAETMQLDVALLELHEGGLGGKHAMGSEVDVGDEQAPAWAEERRGVIDDRLLASAVARDDVPNHHGVDARRLDARRVGGRRADGHVRASSLHHQLARPTPPRSRPGRRRRPSPTGRRCRPVRP
jgi:hypothetical protein